ncbi:MAG: flippase-like domain-containing protein [Candidatus Cloacimonetes bacterium]|nr:flippase-like domain-containing protein [Candidatus Cloacimonadota bacterium]
MKKKILTIVIGTLIGIIFTAIWLQLVDLRTISQMIKDLKLQYVIISILFYLSAYFIRSLRWNLLLKRVQPLSKMRSYLIMMAGNFTNYLIPLRVGELMRCYFIKKMHGTRMTKTLPSVFVDKLFDSIGILFVLLLVPLLSVSLPATLNILLILISLLLIIGCIILISAIYAESKIVSLLKKLFFFIPTKYEVKLDETLSLFVEGLAVFKDHKQLLLPVILFSIIAIFFDSFFFFALFLAFGISINYFYILLGYTLIYLSYIIPHPPAQLGSNELLMFLIFAAGFGMQADKAGAIMLFSHILTGLIIVTIGLISYSYSGVQLLTIINKGEVLNE